jgi:hypothetical protein
MIAVTDAVMESAVDPNAQNAGILRFRRERSIKVNAQKLDDLAQNHKSKLDRSLIIINTAAESMPSGSA